MTFIYFVLIIMCIFEVICVPIVLAQGTLNTVIISFGIGLAVFFALGIVYLWRKKCKNIDSTVDSENKNKKHAGLKLKNLGKWPMNLNLSPIMVVCILLFLYQLYTLFAYQHNDADDAWYLGISSVSWKTNTLFAYSPYTGEEDVYGTSFAAPWISRKLCYLIDVMGLPREIAKALIIDSAAGWEYKLSTYKNQEILGYGIVPIKIEKVLSTDSEEIKFVVYGTSESYKTTNYAIPVPRDQDDKYPYIARAALCYFPECTRAQGVDYTNRELSLNFGRIKANGSIDDINENNQDEVGAHVDERKSRREFRKWENTKFISRVLKNNKPIKSYDERLWGLAITSKERLSSRVGRNLNFGAVITLREVNGVNRIDDFIRACTLRGWIVNEIDIQNRIEVYNNNQEEIIFE